MNKFAVLVLLAVSVAFSSGCGSNSKTAGNINGTWNATLNDSGTGTESFGFVTNLTVNGDGSLATSSINITTNNTSCTFPTESETGTFTLSGNTSGQVSGTFHYVVTSTGTDLNILTLDGTVSGGQITGTWTVTGATFGCDGTGTFTMIPMPGA